MRDINESRIPDWISPQELSQLVGVTSDAVRRWIRAGHISATRATPNSPYRIPLAEVDRLISRLEATRW